MWKRICVLSFPLCVCFFVQSISAQVNLQVNASTTKRPFFQVGLGTNVGIWTYRSYHPASSRDPRLVSVAKEAGIKVIRFPAGNEADDSWFDRNNTTGWSSGSGLYTRTLRADFLNSIKDFSDEIGAQLLLIVNGKIDDPAMAADIVKYCNVDNSFNIKYFEVGNEPTLYKDAYAVTPESYAQRVKRYSDAMKAVDPSIMITGPAIHQPPLIENWLKPFLQTSGTTTDAITIHYYPLLATQTNTSHGQYPSISNLLSFEYPTNASLWHQNGCIRMVNRFMEEFSYGLNHLRDQYSPGAPIGVTELSPTAGGGSLVDTTFAHAIWAADVIGRLSYYGADFITQFLLQGRQSYAIIDSDFNIRPVWYTYVMYKRYFGDSMVETIFNDESKLSIWASRKETEPDKLYLLVINKNQSDQSATLDISGLNYHKALVRVLSAPSISSTTGASIDNIQADQNCTLPDIPGTSVSVAGNTIDYTFKSYSVTSFELSDTSSLVTVSEPHTTLNGTSNWSAQLNRSGLIIKAPQRKNVEILLYDIKGKATSVIYKGFVSSGAQTFTSAAVKTAPGFYLLSVRTRNGKELYRKSLAVFE